MLLPPVASIHITSAAHSTKATISAIAAIAAMATPKVTTATTAIAMTTKTVTTIIQCSLHHSPTALQASAELFPTVFFTIRF